MVLSLLPVRLPPLPDDDDPPPRPAASAAARQVAALFGLPDAVACDEDAAPDPPASLWPAAAGSVALLTGASGAGKSRLLARTLARASAGGAGVIDVARVRLRPRAACVDQFGRHPSPALALGLLARVGLAEAHLCLRPPGRLSDGQRWRLRLAVAVGRCMALHRRGTPTLLAADEFCAVLDRVTACVVARSLRRTIDRLSRVGVDVRAIVATSHDDLAAALLPDVTVRCDFGSVHVA